MSQLIMMIIVMLFALTLSFSFHEFMHAVVADWLGDNTPRLLGRVTLNPLAHMDPVGTVLLLLVGFGWGKPVSYNPNNLRRFKSKRLMNIMVSLAGVTGNFIIGLISMILISIIMAATGFSSRSPVTDCLIYISAGMSGYYDVPFYASVFCFLFYYTFIFSMSLFAFNLLPIPPLDGFRVAEELLPYSFRSRSGYRAFMHYAPNVLLILIIAGHIGRFNVLSFIMGIIEIPVENLINLLAGLIGLLG